MRLENYRRRILSEEYALSYVEANGVPEVALLDLRGGVRILCEGEEARRLFEELDLQGALRMAREAEGPRLPMAEQLRDRSLPIDVEATIQAFQEEARRWRHAEGHYYSAHHVAAGERGPAHDLLAFGYSIDGERRDTQLEVYEDRVRIVQEFDSIMFRDSWEGRVGEAELRYTGNANPNQEPPEWVVRQPGVELSAEEIRSLREEVNTAIGNLVYDGWTGHGWNTPRLDGLLAQEGGTFLGAREAEAIQKELGRNLSNLQLDGWSGWGWSSPRLDETLRAAREGGRGVEMDR